MKIIVANYRYFIAGGPEKYMFKFMAAAQKRGIEVIPFSVSNPQNKSTEYEKYFAEPRSTQLLYKDTKKTPQNLYGMIRSTVWNFDAERRLRKLIRDTNADAVYILHEVNHLSPSIIRAAKKENVRVVHRISDFFMMCAKYDFLCEDEICEACIHGNYRKALKKRCVKGSLFGTALRLFAMKLYWKTGVFNEVDCYVCTCNFTMEKLIEGGISKDKIVCIPTFIDTASIKPNYTSKNYFLFLGRMAHQKGAVYAIRAMKYLKETNFVLKITGDLSSSKEDMEIKKIIKDNELEDKVIFTGFKEDAELEELISNATCIVCPAIWYENMPNTVIEAYAYGKPVVASRIGSLSEIIVDGETGFLFEIKNALDMAEKLQRFVNDPELSSVMGKKARLKCESDYDTEQHMQDVISCLEGNNYD